MYKIILPFRYLLKRRITYLAVLAVALCVFVVLVVITVLSGLTGDFKKNNHRLVGDCVVSSKSLVGFGYYQEFIDRLEKSDFIEATSAVIKNYAIVAGRTSGRAAAKIMGVEAVKHSRVTGFGDSIYYHKGDLENAFRPMYEPDMAGCIPGVAMVLARDSDGRYVRPAEMPTNLFRISCLPLTPKGAPAKAGAGLANTKTFYYSDDLYSKVARVDNQMIFLPFAEAQALCGMTIGQKRINAIFIKFKEDIRLQDGCGKVASMWASFAKEKAGQKYANLLGNVTVQSWKSYRREVIAPVETEQIMMSFVFALIGIVVVFVVFVVFYMIISHKSKDIGILKSIGASNKDIIKVFLGFAALVGVLGSGIGAVCGWRFLVRINQIEDWLFEHFEFQLWDRTLYAIGDIPNQIKFEVLMTIIISAIAASLAGAVLPSLKGTRRKPIETLQVSQM